MDKRKLMPFIKNISLCVLFSLITVGGYAQLGYQKDSIQVKVYTNLYVNDQLQVDSLSVKKVFCDYFSENQLEALKQQSLEITYQSRFQPKYRKKGDHLLAIYLRMPREAFDELKE